MKTVRILIQNRRFEDIAESTLRDYLRVNDYSPSERHDLIERIREDQLTPNVPPCPTSEMFSEISLLTD